MDSEEEQAERFGRFIIEHFHDQVLHFYKGLMEGKWKGHEHEHTVLSSLTQEQQQVVEKSMAEAVDFALHHFLVQIEESGYKGAMTDQEGEVYSVTVNGKDIVQVTDNIFWKLYGEDGWIEKYSVYRQNRQIKSDDALRGQYLKRLLDKDSWNDWRKEHPGMAIDLSAVQLNSFDLNSRDFSGVNFRNASFRNASLIGTNFSSADLRRANLQGAILYNADLSGTDLRDANLQHVNLSGADLSNALIQNADLCQSTFDRETMIPVTFKEIPRRKTIFNGANFNNANLQSAGLRSSLLINVHLINADLRDADLRGADLRTANISGANLQNANIRGAKISTSDGSQDI